ncbi:MAG: phosphohistidine phosphatase SixA [Paraglaciecola sp.]|uniref:phosphohistidine phosphatase SixA n=1 Tax=Paraglaciecola sp. TaxID=1920173 RepID=UPI0032660E09
MKLVIMRHGQAEVLSKPDETRALTALGKQQVSDASNWLAKKLGEKTKIDLALVSPFLRTQQTYDELFSVVNVVKKIDAPDVVPNGDPALFHDYLDTLISQTPAFKTILIISHMPFVCYFLEEINKSKKSMLFDTSSTVVFEYNPVDRNGIRGDTFHP